VKFAGRVRAARLRRAAGHGPAARAGGLRRRSASSLGLGAFARCGRRPNVSGPRLRGRTCDGRCCLWFPAWRASWQGHAAWRAARRLARACSAARVGRFPRRRFQGSVGEWRFPVALRVADVAKVGAGSVWREFGAPPGTGMPLGAGGPRGTRASPSPRFEAGRAGSTKSGLRGGRRG